MKGATMKTRIHAADYYRRMLSMQPHALKRLDAFAKIMACNRGQEIPNNPGRGPAMRSAFRRKAADRRPDAAAGLLLCIGQSE
jgi:hypothetical protein